MAGAFEIDLTVFVRAAFAGGDEIDDDIERWIDSGESSGIRDVDMERGDFFGEQFAVGICRAADAKYSVTLRSVDWKIW